MGPCLTDRVFHLCVKKGPRISRGGPVRDKSSSSVVDSGYAYRYSGAFRSENAPAVWLERVARSGSFSLFWGNGNPRRGPAKITIARRRIVGIGVVFN
jgi:hypothetical protein